MKMTDLIAQKRDGGSLSTEEIQWMIQGFTEGSIPDYQMSAMCMAILLNGMTREETLHLTTAMTNSGDVIDLSDLDGIKADKHSTGGVGDKTSLILCPLLASCGIKMAKMSGRGLGHTGGTLDKLESFHGYSTSISEEKFRDNVKEIGFAITGQTKDIDPADKKLYALRDVTGTVPSIPLIVSSIMSKKLAAGADIIVLDVKTGSGAFMKTLEDARILATEMVHVGSLAGKKTAAVLTDMDEPLGYMVGNALEVKEAIQVLQGEEAGHVRQLCLELGACVLQLGGIADSSEKAKEMLASHIKDGSALEKLADLVEAQGGNREDVYHPERLPMAEVQRTVLCRENGYISHMTADQIGLVSMHLGGGRETKDDVIDLSVGIELKKKVGDPVNTGEALAVIHARTEKDAARAEKELLACYQFSKTPVTPGPFIKEIIMA